MGLQLPKPNRATPGLPVQNMRTYDIFVPADGFRPATCAEYECPGYLNGWSSTIDESTALGQFQAGYIRNESKRGFAEHRNDAGMTVFQFHPGQKPFGDGHDRHRIRVDTPEIYRLRDGDWRGNPTRKAVMLPSAQDWVDDLGENQERLSDTAKRG